jgi:hypothetical protein
VASSDYCIHSKGAVFSRVNQSLALEEAELDKVLDSLWETGFQGKSKSRAPRKMKFAMVQIKLLILNQGEAAVIPEYNINEKPSIILITVNRIAAFTAHISLSYMHQPREIIMKKE